MNRIERKLARLREKGEKALVPFVTAGDPDLGTTEKLVLSMLESGADLVELGVPFSDPVAEGPAVRRASRRALDGGTTLVKIFGLVRRLRKKTDEPLLFLMYLNTVYRFGTERFFHFCAETGVDGVIVPDMPYEEKEEIAGAADANGVLSIRIAAPASHGRVKMIADGAKGFLLCDSSGNAEKNKEFIGTVRKYAQIPCLAEFGSSNPEQAKKVAALCDGIVLESAVVRLLERVGADAEPAATQLVRSLKNAVLLD